MASPKKMFLRNCARTCRHQCVTKNLQIGLDWWSTLSKSQAGTPEETISQCLWMKTSIKNNNITDVITTTKGTTIYTNVLTSSQPMWIWVASVWISATCDGITFTFLSINHFHFSFEKLLSLFFWDIIFTSFLQNDFPFGKLLSLSLWKKLFSLSFLEIILPFRRKRFAPGEAWAEPSHHFPPRKGRLPE